MPIVLNCPVCAELMQASDEDAGKYAKCPNCHADVVVPVEGSVRGFGSDELGAPADRAPHQSRAAPKGWNSFASGCGWVKEGLWIEFAATVYFALLLLAVVHSVGPEPLFKRIGAWAYLPFPLVMLVGTGFVFVGRVRMMAVPPNSGIGGVLIGATLLTAVRGIALLAATALVGYGVAHDEPRDRIVGPQLMDRGLFAAGMAVLPGIFAEITAVMGLGVAGGYLADVRLRRAAGRFVLVAQLAALTYFLLGVAFTVLDDGGPFAPRTMGPKRTGDPRALVLVCAVAYVLFQVVYTAFQSSAYSAGRAAGSDSPPKNADR